MWRILAGLTCKIKLEPGYYKSLTRFNDGSFNEFANIISLDVKRTGDAVVSEDLAAKLTRILLSYAK